MFDQLTDKSIGIVIQTAYTVDMALSLEISTLNNPRLLNIDRRALKLAKQLIHFIEQKESQPIKDLSLDIRLRYISDIDNYLSKEIQNQLHFDNASSERILNSIQKIKVPS